jgi:hypothetical protein
MILVSPKWATLGSVTFLALLLKAFAQQSRPTVNWFSPSEGDTYAAGDVINARWEAEPELVNGTFQLCYASLGKLSKSQQECAPEVYPKQATQKGVYTLNV